jgi:histidine kinase-like protein
VTDRDRFSVELPPDPTELQRLRNDFIRWLDGVGIEGEVRDAVLLATHEAVASAMGSPGDVVVDAAHDEDAVRVVVMSEDGWTSPDDDLGGRRMEIVRRLVNDVSFDKQAGRPRLRFEKPL